MARFSLSGTIYKDLKKKLINSEFKAGDPLIIKDLTKLLGTSPTPIKQAINRLEQEGLIKSFNRKGAFVNILTIKEMKEIFEIRSALEPLAIRLVINSLRQDDLNKFEQQFIKLNKQKEGEIYSKKLIEIIMAFHRFILKGTQNDLLYAFMNNLYCRIEVTKNLMAKHPDKRKVEKSVSEHLKICRALKQKNAEEAEKHMRKHINEALNRMLNLF